MIRTKQITRALAPFIAFLATAGALMLIGLQLISPMAELGAIDPVGMLVGVMVIVSAAVALGLQAFTAVREALARA